MTGVSWPKVARWQKMKPSATKMQDLYWLFENYPQYVYHPLRMGKAILVALCVLFVGLLLVSLPALCPMVRTWGAIGASQLSGLVHAAFLWLVSGMSYD